MTDEEDLDRVRTVLDYMPADLYDEVPTEEREKLASLDRRLNRTVAVKKTEKVDVVVERSTDDVEEDVRALLQRDDTETTPDDVVLTPVEEEDEEPPEVAPTGGRARELTLDEPPDLGTTTPSEPVETEEWPDPDDRYEEQYGADAEPAGDEEETAPWPEPDEPDADEPSDPVPAWPDVDEEPDTAEQGGFREVDPDAVDTEPADDATAWPDVGGDPEPDTADEPGSGGFQEVDEPDDGSDSTDVPAWPDLGDGSSDEELDDED